MSGAPCLTPLTPEQLDDASRSLYDAVMASPRAEGAARRIIVREDGSLTGPFDAWLRTPGLGIHLEPGAHGGVVDLSTVLVDVLNNSNPPDGPCSPILETDETLVGAGIASQLTPMKSRIPAQEPAMSSV